MRPVVALALSPQPSGRGAFISFLFFSMANPSPTAQRPAKTQDATSSANSNRPLASFRFGSVSAAVFTQEVTIDGKTVSLPHVSLERAYRDSQGKWHYTHSLRTSDLLLAGFALMKCYEFLADRDTEREQR